MLKKKMEVIKKNLALRLKLNKIDKCGITAPILLNELLIKKGYIQSKLVQGYMIDDETESACWHLWVECGDTILDISQTLAGFDNCHFERVTNEPDTLYDKNDEVIAQWELYQKDRKKYWKSVDKKIQDYRGKLLSSSSTKKK